MSSGQAVLEALSIVEVMREGLVSLQMVWQKVGAGDEWLGEGGMAGSVGTTMTVLSRFRLWFGPFNRVLRKTRTRRAHVQFGRHHLQPIDR